MTNYNTLLIYKKLSTFYFSYTATTSTYNLHKLAQYIVITPLKPANKILVVLPSKIRHCTVKVSYVISTNQAKLVAGEVPTRRLAGAYVW